MKEVVSKNIISNNACLMQFWDTKANELEGIYVENLRPKDNVSINLRCAKGHKFKRTLLYVLYKDKIVCPVCREQELQNIKQNTYEGFSGTQVLKIKSYWDFGKNNAMGVNIEKLCVTDKHKYFWKCVKGHSWSAAVSSIIVNKREVCPECEKQRNEDKQSRSIANLYPDVVKEWDFEKNTKEGFALENMTYGSCKKAWWKCSLGHSYQMRIADRVRNHGCPTCGHIKQGKSMKARILDIREDIVANNPAIFKEWHYERNKAEGQELATQTLRTNTSYWWHCDKGHEWKATIASRLQGTKCPYCLNKKVWQGYNDITVTVPELLKEWDFEKNSALGIRPEEYTRGIRVKVWWKCELGHSWMASLQNRTSRKVGCPYCAKKRILKGYNDALTVYPQLKKYVDWDKNKAEGIDVFTKGTGSKSEVWWRCDYGHSWKKTVQAMIRGYCGCKECLQISQLPYRTR